MDAAHGARACARQNRLEVAKFGQGELAYLALLTLSTVGDAIVHHEGDSFSYLPNQLGQSLDDRSNTQWKARFEVVDCPRNRFEHTACHQ
eukprot:7098926-Pyramimonas_sp.AAC.1